MTTLTLFCILLYHTQGLPWYFGALAYTSLAAELIYAAARGVKRIIEEKS